MAEQSIQKQVQAAVKALAGGRVEEAGDLARKVLVAVPEQPDALLVIAGVQFQYGNDRRVADLAMRALNGRPGDPRPFLLLADLQRKQGQPEAALSSLREALKRHPELNAVYRDMGFTVLEAGDPEGAVARFEEALKVLPDDPGCRVGMAEALLELGRADDAAPFLEAVLAAHPDQPRALAGMGRVHAARGAAAKARDCFERARQGNPELPWPHRGLGDLLHAEGRLEEAVAAYRKYLDLEHGGVTLAKRFRTDKWGGHYYAGHYHHHFEPRRLEALNVLEIGVGGYRDPMAGGASLRMWKAYFPNSSIYSIDLYDKAPVEEERIRIFQGSQDDPGFLKKVAREIGRIDIIIDDGSHINDHVVGTFKTLFPLLADDGIYAVEDTHTSYWPPYGGSSEDLSGEGTMLGFLKGLTDGLNYEEILRPGHKPSYFERHIVSMHFYHNLVVIHKGDNREGSMFVKNGALPPGFAP